MSPSNDAKQAESPEDSMESDSLEYQVVAPGIVRNVKNEVVVGFAANFMLYPIVLIYFIITFWYVITRVVPYQFIDEIFHVNQTITYLRGNWTQWDPKITTPPGIYLLGWLYHHTIKPVFKNWSTLTILRIVNLTGGTIILPIVVLRPLFLFNAIGFWPVSLMCFPIMTSYYYLFYTDVWSTIFILESLTLTLTLPFGSKKSLWLSSLCGGISCLFRQTNIVWIGFIMLVTVERRAMISKQFSNHTFNNYLKTFIFAVEEFNDVILPYFINFILFFIYLLWNRSITLGDKSNHSVSIHIMQYFYMTLFVLFFTVPIWCSRNFLKSYIYRCVTRIPRTIFEIIGIMICIRYFTRIHPFLLADNRHLTFYLYRRFIGSPYKLIKYFFMAPLYHFASFVYFEIMRPNEMKFDAIIPLPVKEVVQLPIQLTHISWTALLICTIVTLIPSPLFEPRYFILPYYFWRIFVTCNAEPIIQKLEINTNKDDKPLIISSVNRLFLELVWFMVINIIILLIFIKHPFVWVNEEFLQRITW